MVRLRRMPRRARNPPTPTNSRHDIHLQEMQESVSKERFGIRGSVRTITFSAYLSSLAVYSPACLSTLPTTLPYIPSDPRNYLLYLSLLLTFSTLPVCSCTFPTCLSTRLSPIYLPYIPSGPLTTFVATNTSQRRILSKLRQPLHHRRSHAQGRAESGK